MNAPLIEMTPFVAFIALFLTLFFIIFTGFPMAWALGGAAMIIGYLAWGSSVWALFYSRLFGIATSVVLLAVPLFIFMGIMVEKSGISERLFNALYLWLGGLRGGLAISVIVLGTIIAATVGVIGASIVMLGLISMPALLRRGYAKDLACGSVMAGGCLGILIPPSVMLVVIGPIAQVSVGKLFMAAFPAGLLLSSLYILYIGGRCLIRPRDGLAMPAEERAVGWGRKLFLLFTSLLPPVFLILGVLGSIFFGIAAPTEAAAVGCVLATLLTVAYKSFSTRMLFETVKSTMRTTSMMLIIVICALMFSAVFMALGCGKLVSAWVMAVPFGRWGAFALIMIIVFFLGMFISWEGIVFITMPIVIPITKDLGFDPLWFIMMIVVNIQMAFLTPPFASAIFYLKGINRPEWGIDIRDMIRAVVPFILIIMTALGLMIAFPQILLWLPGVMLK